MLNANFTESMNLQAARYCFKINRITGLDGRLRPDFNWTPNRTYPPLFYFKFYSTPPKTRELKLSGYSQNLPAGAMTKTMYRPIFMGNANFGGSPPKLDVSHPESPGKIHGQST